MRKRKMKVGGKITFELENEGGTENEDMMENEGRTKK